MDTQLILPIDTNPIQAVLTNRLQVADILETVLEYTGPAEIWQSTFSVSEEFLRRMYFIRKKKNILAAHLLFDHKAAAKTLKLWPFIERTYDTAFMSDNHSKVLLVKAKKKEVTVITSQNLTRGNRYESTVITTAPEIFGKMMQEFQEISTAHSIPLDEILRQKTPDD